ncbi:MAG: tRNA threonylcarbamoyladenosine dehydratase [Clostridia bacterium]|nr:tRNA threonylcarbamoyladenosine dehydratase [Clostridia bacterium]
MNEQFTRTELIYGRDGIEKLSRSRVAVFGIGGVGGHACEALARSGIGHIDLIDDDRVCLSNINRQIIALHSTVGKYKVDAMESRLLDINPDIKITKHNVFFTPENADSFDFSEFDYVIDAIDTISGKIALVMKADENGVNIISSMGAGNKTNPSLFEVSDIYKTSVCPLARVMRNELRKRNIKRLKVVYSKEQPLTPKAYMTASQDTLKTDRSPKGSYVKQAPGSTAFVPSVAGLIIAGEVINDLSAM